MRIMTDQRATLTLGPCLFNWRPETWRDFYFRIADEAPVDTVCVGEVVCSKRAPYFDPVLPDVLERLESAGKQVVISTLGLIMTEREMESVRAIAAEPAFLVEANDISACSLLAGRPHGLGPMLNVYNEGTLRFLAARGAEWACLPPELPASSIAVLAATGVARTEVLVFGRMPLAISARCYHARSRGWEKDSCQYACGDDPDGMDLETVDGTPFLAVNGTQTMSYSYCNLVGELEHLRAMGVHRFRLSPHATDMVAVAGTFRDVLDGRLAPAEAGARLVDLTDDVPFSNGFFHGVEGKEMLDDDRVDMALRPRE